MFILKFNLYVRFWYQAIFDLFKARDFYTLIPFDIHQENIIAQLNKSVNIDINQVKYTLRF